ncbi:aryl hydrocarbon receptor-like isoform X1 [Stigmatopora nigra]
MLATSGTYANKKRKKPVLKQKGVKEGNELIKSNPSKRHRDRLNGELDRLTDLLPFSEDVRSCLDKLSVLRLSVGYLRVKSYFNATIKNSSSHGFQGGNGTTSNNLLTRGFSETDLLLQALNGFVLVVTSEGFVFYTSSTIKEYLGFQQSDVVHQSVFELIHTDDRTTFRQNLHFALNPPDTVGEDCLSREYYNPEQLPPENSSFLERTFVCRFRCLLDNSSGFLALKFQGRLKYLHGQSVFRDNGSHSKPQLALFSIAMPVQSPSIVEIRSKMLLFQTKHKLDFTPLGVDNRGKIILGYSETELCMKGSGYQFIHAADMMHVADNHTRMIKTGESGLTVFRLLTKSGSWIWVKSNAKLIYKGGRPEFIIAYQRAMLNAEGEEYLRQRRLMLPFSFTTGEAVLYNSGPMINLAQTQFNKHFNNNDDKYAGKDTEFPRSLLDCFLRQDESAYRQTEEVTLAVDEIFRESGALVSVPCNAWQETGLAATSSAQSIIKEEAKHSVMAVINSLQDMAHKGDFKRTLKDLVLDDSELMQIKESLMQLGEEGDQQESVRSELDNVLLCEIFDYIDAVLYKECPSTCVKQDAIMPQPQQFPTTPQNNFYSGQNFAESARTFTSAKELSDCQPLPVPPIELRAHQQLQLHNIFSPEIELPEIIVPDRSAIGGPVPFSGFGQQQQPVQRHQNISHSMVPPVSCKDFNNQNAAVSNLKTFNSPWSHTQYKVPHQTISHNDPVFKSHTFPSSETWPRVSSGPHNAKQAGQACDQADQSSCMYTLPLTHVQSSHQRHPHGSCYVQWDSTQPVVGTLAISEDNTNISPMAASSIFLPTMENL